MTNNREQVTGNKGKRAKQITGNRGQGSGIREERAKQITGNREQITKGRGFFALLAVSCYLLFVFACNNITDSPKQQPVGNGYGKVSVNVVNGENAALGKAARTVFPSPVFSRYVYTFTNTETSVAKEETPDAGFFTLEVGTYTVKVEAFIGR